MERHVIFRAMKDVPLAHVTFQSERAHHANLVSGRAIVITGARKDVQLERALLTMHIAHHANPTVGVRDVLRAEKVVQMARVIRTMVDARRAIQVITAFCVILSAAMDVKIVCLVIVLMDTVRHARLDMGEVSVRNVVTVA